VAEGSLLGSSAVMALGTIVSRLSGFVRGALLLAALGSGLHADIFNIANTIPNMLYILLAGGLFNAVLVPQLVRAMKGDPDGGEGYTNRIITLAGCFLLVVSVVLVAAAPLVMRVVLDSDFFTPAYAEQRDSAIAFARYCLPQVFFYGMFVLVGQVLNARGTFGPMMWAPIANNLVSVLVLGAYLLLHGTAEGEQLRAGFSTDQEALLGLGATAGIAVQLLVLLPYLRRAGVRYRPQFDFRGTGLGHTLRLGTWTVLFVVVNQIAYTVVVRLASTGTADSAGGTGYTIYSNSFLLVMVPHAIITVSLATAVLPRLSAHAARQAPRELARDLGSVIRTTYAALLPILAAVPIVAQDLAGLAYGWGATSDSYTDFVPTLSIFALGVACFTAHYLVLRGFYALEQTRRVFWIQCLIAAINIGAALTLVHGSPPAETAPRLAAAYTIAYGVGAVLSFALLRHDLGGLEGRRLLRFGLRVILATMLATGVTLLVHLGLTEWLDSRHKVLVLVRLAVLGGVQLLGFAVFARAFRIGEVTEVVALVRARVRRKQTIRP
jgi:putative peptidoglycan lipid II flippase